MLKTHIQKSGVKMAHFDHIVVGGGAAGCVAAARLVSDGNARVLLLEAGYSHHHPLLDMPPGIFKMINGSKFMRYHKTIAQEHLGGRSHDIPQGHVLGGGSSVNAQVYMRGRPEDYDEWETLLRDCAHKVGWSWKDVLTHFRRMESNNRLSNDLHGNEGPLLVSDPGHIDPVSRWFVQAIQQMGEPYNTDFNGETQRGVGFYQFTNRNGRRSSAAYAYLSPLRHNPNLTIRLQSEVEKIILHNHRATGVLYRDKSGEVHEVQASGEVIIAAGALVTPKILMLSGIGPAHHLKQHEITCHLDLPGVGQNLIDHPEVPITARIKGRHGYYKQGTGWRMLRNGLQFKLFGTGPVTSAGVEAGAFINPENPAEAPNIQAFCVPIVYVDRDACEEVQDGYGMTITTVVVKPRSRGYVKLASSNPQDMPIVSPNLLKEAEDMREMIAGQRFFIKAFQQQALKENIAQLLLPAQNDMSDQALQQHCRRFVKTNYHPSGTAKMGADTDVMAVLDPQMRVRGISHLRVCDMSAVPNINAGNTNAPAMMLGDRCADFILGKI